MVDSKMHLAFKLVMAGMEDEARKVLKKSPVLKRMAQEIRKEVR
jgi:hypothetical protein